VISPKFDALVLRGIRPFRLGLLGGTFDPVHYGHLLLAEQAYEQFDLDGVLFIPTGQPVRKLGTGFSQAEDRYTLLLTATEDSTHFDVSRIEMDREGVSYSIDTVRAIKAVYGEQASLFFITGADATDDMATWKDAQELAGLVTVLGANRGEASSALKPSPFTVCHFHIPALAISSQDIRARLAGGGSARYLTPDAVLAYSQRQGLYRSRGGHA
jgi:nicotinate-nucleotide adenylyltransferase